ncbi:MAG: YARHG domain-containing protein [Nitrospiraceae bacterium]|nr:YARHG domain-containing protein [Nitrospiraceae bacterium]
MTRCLFSFLVLFLFSCVPLQNSYADDSVYEGNGYQVFPTKSSEVQLVAETITITDNKAFGHSKRNNFGFDVDMTFKNHGGDTVLQMGFPVLVDDIEGEQIEIDTHFRTWVNGQEVAISKKEGIPNPGIKDSHFSKLVFTYSVEFKRGETKQIKHTYDVGGISDSMGGLNLKYILRTGGHWKSVIEDYYMIFKTKTSNAKELIGTLPREQKAELIGDVLVLSWNIKNFKPKNDFLLQGGSSRFPLISRPVSQDMIEIKKFHGIMPSSQLRYAKNKVFASYGYPFKNPFIRAQFYYPGSRYEEKASFSEQKMSKEHLDYIAWLSKLEEDHMKPGQFDDKDTNGSFD